MRISDLLVLLCWCLPASAETGGSAFWWSPEQSGSGLAIDIQANRGAAIEFAYRSNGSAVWYLMSGEVNEGDFEPPLNFYRYFDGMRELFRNGQCLGCEPRDAEVARQLGQVGVNVLGYGELAGYSGFYSNSLTPMSIGYGTFDISNCCEGIPDFRGEWLVARESGPMEGPVRLNVDSAEVVNRGGQEIAGTVVFSGESGSELSCRTPTLSALGGYGQCSIDHSSIPLLIASFEKVGLDRILFNNRYDRESSEEVPDRWHGIRLSDRPVSDGLWWNRDAPGSGLLIEEQNGVVAVVYFTYRPNGRAIWYLASGKLGEDAVFEAPLQEFRGGQCLECDYTAPELARERRTIRIEFLGNRIANLAVGNLEPVTIERMNFGYQEFGVPSLAPGGVIPDLRGSWVFANLDQKGSKPFRVDLSSVEETVVTEDGDTKVVFDGPGALVVCDFPAGSFKSFEAATCRLYRGGEAHLFAESFDVNFDVIRGDLDGDRWIGFRIAPMS